MIKSSRLCECPQQTVSSIQLTNYFVFRRPSIRLWVNKRGQSYGTVGLNQGLMSQLQTCNLPLSGCPVDRIPPHNVVRRYFSGFGPFESRRDVYPRGLRVTRWFRECLRGQFHGMVTRWNCIIRFPMASSGFWTFSVPLVCQEAWIYTKANVADRGRLDII